MNRQSVSSAHIAAVGYDPLNRVLEVEFANGSCYAYRGVSQEKHKQMMASPSHGQFLFHEIKDQHTCERIK